jgi:hypothetical protein
VEIQEMGEQGISFKGPNVCLAIFENENLATQSEIILRDHLISKKENQNSPVRFNYLGRTDLVLNRGGQKISLEAIESELGHYLERSCLCLSFFEQRLGEDLGILIAPSNAEENVQDFEKIKSQAIDFLKENFGIYLSEINIKLVAIPHNANGKLDRMKALSEFLRSQSWVFPISIQHLQKYLPHRGSAIWIDSILETKKRYGVGLIKIDLEKNYCSNQKVRESSCIEWIAQTYGYTVALNDILGLAPMDIATKVFIAEIRSAEFAFQNTEFKAGDELKVEVTCTHDFGPLKLLQGKVYSEQSQNHVLADIGLTVYIE